MSLLLCLLFSCTNDTTPEKPPSEKQNKEVTLITLSSVKEADILITEVMHDPDKALDYRGEWIEIYNNSSQKIDLKGLIVKSSGEDGFTIEESKILEPEQYFVLAANGTKELNGNIETDYNYPYKSFKITGQEDITISTATITIDKVQYKAAARIQTGYSLSLDSLKFQDRNNGTNSNWCPSSSPYQSGDFGTPGKKNDPCHQATSLKDGDIIFTELMTDPQDLPPWKAEWIEIFNPTDKVINLNGLSLISRGEDGVKIQEDVYIFPKEYFVLGTSDHSTNGGISIDFRYNYNLLKMFEGDSISLQFAETIIDSVAWKGVDWPDQKGKARNLSINMYSAAKNDNLQNWCSAQKVYGPGNFGTPKEPNIECDGLGLITEELPSN